MSTDLHSTPSPAPKRRTWKYWYFRSLLIYIGIPYVAIFVFMGVYQRDFIYQPKKTGRLLADAVSSTPPVEDVELPAADGLMLHGWRYRAVADTDAKFLVIYFPGNAGCRADRVSDCRDFTQLGFDVILFDYRGYGDNKGSPSETLLAGDASQVWKFATNELHYSPDRVVLFGESMGGAMATRLASDLSVAGTPPAALILNSTFASLAETVTWHYPVFPFQFILLDRYPSVERIARVTCPVLQFHGTADEVVAFEHGQRLFNAAPARSATGIEKQFVQIPHGQHNFITMSEMRDAVQALMNAITAADVPVGES
ncbi:MAG: hypothetical protein JWP89_1349 [Schlesneria sp.]|nr:hypothetical protein [Schlesneria sp.]